MIAPPPSPRPAGNKILAALRGTVSPDYFSRLERVPLTRGEVVYEAESRIDYVYFPETAVFSLLSLMKEGETVEVGPVGDEGMVGLGVFLGADTSLYRVVVHVAGTAMRLSAGELKEALGDGRGRYPAGYYSTRGCCWP